MLKRLRIDSSGANGEVRLLNFAKLRYGQAVYFHFAGPASLVKAMAAGLRVGDEEASWYVDNDMVFVKERFRVVTEPLPKYALLQAVAIAKRADLVFGDRDEDLYAFLMQPDFTTPVLPEWVPYIRSMLIAKDMLTQADCYGVQCRICQASTHTIDTIVTQGLKNGSLQICKK